MPVSGIEELQVAGGATRRTKRHRSAAAIEQQCGRGLVIAKTQRAASATTLGEDHGRGSGAHLNGTWPPASQERALMAAKASAGLAKASEEDGRTNAVCAMARQPE